MTILLDIQQTMISALMTDAHLNNKEINEALIKHSIFNTIRSYKQRFGHEYGSLVICCDSKQSWRRDFYPHYKAHRKKDREARGFDWDQVFRVFDEARDALRLYFPYKIIQVDKAEADDVIATIVSWERLRNKKDILIISSDKDFLQLQKFENVFQYSPIQKSVLVEFNPELYLKEHILRGDRNDGIPNVLSPDNSFVDGIRQKTLRQTHIDELVKDWNSLAFPHFRRNQTLIDFGQIPKEIRSNIILEYEKDINKSVSKSQIFHFFIKNKLGKLIEYIDEF